MSSFGGGGGGAGELGSEVSVSSSMMDGGGEGKVAGGNGEGRTMQPAPTEQWEPTETRWDVLERGAKVLELPTEGDSMPAWSLLD